LILDFLISSANVLIYYFPAGLFTVLSIVAPKIVKALKHDNWEIRRYAAIVLGEFSKRCE